jgi:hypothetical protein
MIVKVTATIDPGFVSENKKNIAVFLEDFKQMDQSKFR